MEHGNQQQKMEWLFRLHDLDGNGSIDKIEMLEIVKVGICIFWILKIKFKIFINFNVNKKQKYLLKCRLYMNCTGSSNPQRKWRRD